MRTHPLTNSVHRGFKKTITLALAFVVLGAGSLIAQEEADPDSPSVVAGSSISGTAYYDRNKNGVKDRTESGPAGVKISLIDAATGDVVGSGSTNKYGDYTLSGVPDGAFYISFGGKTRSPLIEVGLIENRPNLGGKNPIPSGKNPAYSSKNVILDSKNPVDGGKNPFYSGGKNPLPSSKQSVYVETGQYVTDINVILPPNLILTGRPRFVDTGLLNPRNIPRLTRPPARPPTPTDRPEFPPAGEGGSVSPFVPGQPGSQIEGLKDILEFRNEGEDGLTPGFWKNRGLKEGWPDGYLPGDSLESVFGETFANLFANQYPNGISLQEAVNLGGGGANALARHAVAAVLNAAAPDVNYPFAIPDIVNAVNIVTPDATSGNVGVPGGGGGGQGGGNGNGNNP